MNLSEMLDAEILARVEKPSQYLGNEFNAVRKAGDEVELRIALVFPDLYEMGLGNLGLLILYAILNRLPWCWCERAYAPAPDMEAELRARGAGLFALESKDSLEHFDLVGFTLQSELTYTTVLNMLELAGIPVRSADRDDRHPLVCAGGPSAFNPEPMAAFIDFFVIGEAEEAIVEVAECLRERRGQGRREKLEALAEIEGVYVPALYPFETGEGGAVLPAPGGKRIRKRLMARMDEAPFPTDYLVPFTQQIHDRLGVEVHRGCTHGCRFCHAGMVTRPVRERSCDEVERLMVDLLQRTGYEEVSLLSLSTCDHSEIERMVERVQQRAQEARASVSLPSLRLDSFSVALADLVTGMRRSGLTFAPEAATPRMRALINKPISDEALVEVCVEAIRRGSTHVKLYFMIGFPTEQDEDVQAIVELTVRVLEACREVNPKARLNVGVSTFVPKPITPLQWTEQIGAAEIRRRHEILRRGFAVHPGIKFGHHSVVSTFIEGLLSRADRRAGDLIEAAWRHGARLETWSEHIGWGPWQQAIAETGFDEAGAFRLRNLEEHLPWDHIDALVSKEWLRGEWERAMALESTPDCRQAGCQGCGIASCEMRRRPARGPVPERPVERPGVWPDAEGIVQQVQRFRFRIGREGLARFLSHRELADAWIRALRRAQAPVAYSQGFRAHPKVTFSTAPPVGEESEGDYMDVVLCARAEPGALLAALERSLPLGLQVYGVEEVPVRTASLMSIVAGYRYRIRAAGGPEDLEARIERLLWAGEILVERRKKARSRRKKKAPGMRTVDIRPMIQDVRVCGGSSGLVVELELDTVTEEKRGVRVREVLALLGLEESRARVRKLATVFTEEAGGAASG